MKETRVLASGCIRLALEVEAHRLLHKRLLQTTFVISGVLIAAAPVFTQSANPVVFRGGTNAVMLQVSVTAGKGERVDGLTAEDFTVLEDGVPQTISHFSKAD